MNAHSQAPAYVYSEQKPGTPARQRSCFTGDEARRIAVKLSLQVSAHMPRADSQRYCGVLSAAGVSDYQFEARQRSEIPPKFPL